MSNQSKDTKEPAPVAIPASPPPELEYVRQEQHNALAKLDTSQREVKHLNERLKRMRMANEVDKRTIVIRIRDKIAVSTN